MFVEGIEWCFLEQVVWETLIKIVLFLIPVAEQMFVVSVDYWLPTDTDLQEICNGKVLKFGAVDTYPSLQQVNTPASTDNMDACIYTDVGGCEIPLPISKGRLKNADAWLVRPCEW